MTGGGFPLNRLHRAAQLVAGLMFAAVFVIFCLKIAMRYIGHNEMAWTDEVSIILFVWIVFWANAFILREQDHIRFDLVYALAPDRGKRVMAVLRAIFIGGVFLYALPQSVDYILFLWRERTPVLELRLDYVYFCFILLMAMVPIRAAWTLVGLFGARWREHL